MVFLFDTLINRPYLNILNKSGPRPNPNPQQVALKTKQTFNPQTLKLVNPQPHMLINLQPGACRVVITDHKRLTDLISRRKRGQPLITVSNHQSSVCPRACPTPRSTMPRATL